MHNLLPATHICTCKYIGSYIVYTIVCEVEMSPVICCCHNELERVIDIYKIKSRENYKLLLVQRTACYNYFPGQNIKYT